MNNVKNVTASDEKSRNITPVFIPTPRSWPIGRLLTEDNTTDLTYIGETDNEPDHQLIWTSRHDEIRLQIRVCPRFDRKSGDYVGHIFEYTPVDFTMRHMELTGWALDGVADSDPYALIIHLPRRFRKQARDAIGAFMAGEYGKPFTCVDDLVPRRLSDWTDNQKDDWRMSVGKLNGAPFAD